MRIGDQWHKRIPRDCKCTDRKKNRDWDPKKMVDTEWCLKQVDLQQNKCHYCGVFMDWINRQKPNGLTVERLKAGHHPHHKDNCTLCCFRCNTKRMTPSQKILKKYLYMWYRKVFDVQVQTTGERRPSFLQFTTP